MLTKCIDDLKSSVGDGLNSMHLDHPSTSNFLLGEKAFDLFTLITLKLDDSAKFLVLYDAAVAAKLLLEGLGKLGEIKLFIQTLDGGKGFAAVALLQTDVDNALGHDLVIAVGVGKRVKWRGDPCKSCGLFVAH